jgi:Zn-finger nucleic acid-binding protein
MSLECPRCASTLLTERPISPTGGGAPMEVYLCNGCQGVWLDGPTLNAICPTLAHLPQHRDEIALVGCQGAGIALCLRCGVAPFEYQVLGVAIDFCLRCSGVWLDGDEYEEAMLTGAEPAPALARGGPYRRSANALAGDVKCAYCGASVDPKKAYVRERGAACTRCHYAQEQRVAQRRATDAWTELPGQTAVVHARSVLEALVMSLRALLDWQREVWERRPRRDR